MVAKQLYLYVVDDETLLCNTIASYTKLLLLYIKTHSSELQRSSMHMHLRGYVTTAVNYLHAQQLKIICLCPSL